jgi:hypothetical protein
MQLAPAKPQTCARERQIDQRKRLCRIPTKEILVQLEPSLVDPDARPVAHQETEPQLPTSRRDQTPGHHYHRPGCSGKRLEHCNLEDCPSRLCAKHSKHTRERLASCAGSSLDRASALEPFSFPLVSSPVAAAVEPRGHFAGGLTSDDEAAAPRFRSFKPDISQARGPAAAAASPRYGNCEP